MQLTRFAAQVVRAPGGRAQDVLSAVYRNVVVGACAVPGERFAAQKHRAPFVVAFHLVGTFDRSVASWAGNGVAELIAAR